MKFGELYPFLNKHCYAILRDFDDQSIISQGIVNDEDNIYTDKFLDMDVNEIHPFVGGGATPDGYEIFVTPYPKTKLMKSIEVALEQISNEDNKCYVRILMYYDNTNCAYSGEYKSIDEIYKDLYCLTDQLYRSVFLYGDQSGYIYYIHNDTAIDRYDTRHFKTITIILN